MAHSRCLALEGHELLLDWPVGGIEPGLALGTTVDVYFEHAEARLAFRTRTQGKVRWNCPRRGPLDAWRLAVPLCIEQRQQRDHQRISLLDLHGAPAHFASVNDPDLDFHGRLINISGGGLGGIAPLDAAPRVRTGQLYWANFELPGEPRPFEFVVRIVHARAAEGSGVLTLGGMFCPGEDPQYFRNQLRRIEQFVAQQRCTPTERPRRHNLKGT